MEDLLAGIFTFRGLLFHWFFVLSLLVFYSSTQEGKRHFSLFEERILTDLEAEINLVNFHIRGIGPGRALTSSVYISGYSRCKWIEFSRVREKDRVKRNLLRFTVSVHYLKQNISIL